MTRLLQSVLFAILSAGLARGQAAAVELRLAVVSQDDASIAEIDLGSNKVVATLRVAKGPASIATTADGALMFASYPDRKAIGVVDTRTGAVLRDLPFKGEPFGVAAGQDAVYVSDWANDTIGRVGLTAEGTTAIVAVGKSPAHLVFDAAAHRLYVADRNSNDISVIDTESMRHLASVPTGIAPYALALAPNGRRLYVANVQSNDLAVIDTARLERIATVPVGKLPYGVAVTPDGASILVTNQHGNSLSVIDAGRLEVVATIPTGRYPEGVYANAAGRAYVANWFSGDVSVIDLAARREVGRIKVGEGPRSFALLPGPFGSP